MRVLYKTKKCKQKSLHAKGGRSMSIKVMCPICNKRVFDIKQRASGEIQIKCPHCRNVISVELKSKSNN